MEKSVGNLFWDWIFIGRDQALESCFYSIYANKVGIKSNFTKYSVASIICLKLGCLDGYSLRCGFIGNSVATFMTTGLG